MTDITAEILQDSVSEGCPRLVTLKLRYPRLIHAELMTHRVFSRNARSSRAVPVARMIAECEKNPVIPLHWGAAQAGMQAYEQCCNEIWLAELGFSDPFGREQAWLKARDYAVSCARAFVEAGYAKQLVNRLLEPFLHIDVIVTSTEWDNWFRLRDHEAAEPHIQILAREMKRAMAESVPVTLYERAPGAIHTEGWHLPYVDQATVDRAMIYCEVNGCGTADVLLKVSAARCARISYSSHDDGGEPSIRADVALAEKLVAQGHWSPLEHQATPAPRDSRSWGNFFGWAQYRRITETGQRVADKLAHDDSREVYDAGFAAGYEQAAHDQKQGNSSGVRLLD